MKTAIRTGVLALSVRKVDPPANSPLHLNICLCYLDLYVMSGAFEFAETNQ